MKPITIAAILGLTAWLAFGQGVTPPAINPRTVAQAYTAATNAQTTANAAYLAATNRPVAYAIGNIAGTVAPNVSDGLWQSASLTNTTILSAPTNGYAGARLELWLTASGGDRTLTITNSIAFPSDSAFTGTKTLTSNQTYIILLRSSNGTNWWLQSLVGGY